ncbi:MAG: electron transport complex subunit RsxC [Arenimonas sp.]|nr:electron transport complex subunit RsxC [Arenimonas sp.]
MPLHEFHGGLVLAGHKAESTGRGLQACALPALLRVSLLQHAGTPAGACVAAGDTVAAGQRIGIAQGELSADVHSPCAGRVVAVEAHALARFPGLEAGHVVIEPGAALSPQALPAMDWQASDPAALRERIRAAGVVGLGGAGFPTAGKLSVARDLLVLNGAECEPWIACDDALLREHADEVVLGGRLMARVVGAGRVLLAIEDTMPEALAAARAAAAAAGDGLVEVVAVPTIYPEGGERQLIQVLTGLEVPRGGLPRDIGVIVQNVATARAAWRAVALGEPLSARVVTVTGRGVARPGNFIVPIGTSVAHLVEQAGGYTDSAARLLLGGPMMGQALPHDDFPIGKQDNCVLVLSADECGERAPEMPCIRCGDCASACPAQLLPQQLLWHVRADNAARAQDQGLFDCIECGCCDLACPSHIPLTQAFRRAKFEIRVRAVETERALAARDRHDARKLRHERESAELAQRHEARRAGTAGADAVAAALERARVKRAPGHDTDASP